MLLEAETNKYCPGGNDFGAISYLITWVLNFFLSVGLAAEFHSEKIPRIYSEQLPLFRGRKCSFRGIPSSAEEPIPKLGTKWNGMEFRGKK